MKMSMATLHKELETMVETIDDITSELSEKMDDMRRETQDRDMTDEEMEKYDDLLAQFNNFDYCLDHIQNAMNCLEGNIIE